MTTTHPWVEVEAPTSTSRDAILEFFGIPPDPEARLAENIDLKRRQWHRRGQAPKGADRARRVKELIGLLADHLLKGQPLPAGALDGAPRSTESELPPPAFQDVEQLLDLLSALLSRGQLDRALATAREGRDRFPQDGRSHAMFAYIVAASIGVQQALEEALILEALGASEHATDLLPAESSGWFARVVLLGALGRLDEAAGLEQEVRVRLGAVPPSITIAIAQALLDGGRVDESLTRIIGTIRTNPEDAGLRSEATHSLLVAAQRLLPLQSAEAANRYGDIVAVAAWCANGVAEAEEIIRPHRMWAERSRSRVFVGSYRLRTLLAFLTVFVSLPFHNQMRSEPQWEVLLKGPALGTGPDGRPRGRYEFFLVANHAFLRAVHSTVRMPWAHEGGDWPRETEFTINED